MCSLRDPEVKRPDVPETLSTQMLRPKLLSLNYPPESKWNEATKCNCPPIYADVTICDIRMGATAPKYSIVADYFSLYLWRDTKRGFSWMCYRNLLSERDTNV